MSQTKTGNEIVKDFFESLSTRDDLDKEIVKVLVDLHNQQKLTSTNISNQMDVVRKKELDVKNK
jgi:hypothetical protein